MAFQKYFKLFQSEIRIQTFFHFYLGWISTPSWLKSRQPWEFAPTLSFYRVRPVLTTPLYVEPTLTCTVSGCPKFQNIQHHPKDWVCFTFLVFLPHHWIVLKLKHVPFISVYMETASSTSPVTLSFTIGATSGTRLWKVKAFLRTLKVSQKYFIIKKTYVSDQSLSNWMLEPRQVNKLINIFLLNSMLFKKHCISS